MAIASSLADVSARLSGFMLAFRLPDWLLHELQDKLVLLLNHVLVRNRQPQNDCADNKGSAFKSVGETTVCNG
jgi:hypothetical protein